MTTTLPDAGCLVATRGRTRYQARLAAKRLFDLLVAGAVLVVLSPVLVVITAVLLVTEGRPILFRQKRVGRYGQPFTMWKFRTMVVDAEHQLHRLRGANERTGPLFKMASDPRVTRIGRFLRATSLDELPQLANVLAGTMSMVGPRPALYEEREAFTPDLLAREDMPPGITGLWQVEARTDGDFDRYRQLDLRYVEEWTLRLDLWLLVKTPFMVVRHALAPAVVADIPSPPPLALVTGPTVSADLDLTTTGVSEPVQYELVGEAG
jgi:lipopolysaccharide/colanic/teichoic acid biosynthesis glycosyltransferase